MMCNCKRGGGGRDTKFNITPQAFEHLAPLWVLLVKKKKKSVRQFFSFHIYYIFHFLYTLYISFYLMVGEWWIWWHDANKLFEIRLNLIKENNFSIFKFGLLKTTYWTATTHIRHSAGIANTCDWFTPEVWNIRRIQSNVLCNAKPADPFHHHRLTCSA